MMSHSRTIDRRRQAGFTLVELLVVLVILGLLVGIAAPRVMQYVSGSRTKTAAIEIKRLATALELFYLDVGRYPTDTEGLRSLVEMPGDLENWNGPYIREQSALSDPWGHPYVYEIPGEDFAFDLQSLGADGMRGGEGPEADIGAWE